MKTLDPFHAQIVLSYLKSKNDFLNFIQVKKQFQNLLDRFRINPIKITEETKNLFQYLDTQQIFGIYVPNRLIFTEDENEIQLDSVKIIQFNYRLHWDEYQEIYASTTKDVKCKHLHCNQNVWEDKKDELKYSNIKSIDVSLLSTGKINPLNLPKSVHQIHGVFFTENNTVKKLIIPDQITSLDFGCFRNNTVLEEIVLSTNLTCLHSSTFNYCISLTKIEFPPYLQRIGLSCFSNCKIASFENLSTCTLIESCAFDNCQSLTKVVLNNMKVLSNSLFRGCSQLVDVQLNDEIERIEKHCFRYCSSLKTLKMPSSLKVIGFECFDNCTSLESIILPEEMVFIEENAFNNCNQLKEFIIQNNTCIIDRSIFKGCTSLTKIQIPLFQNKYCLYDADEEESMILKKNGIECIEKLQRSFKSDLNSIQITDQNLFNNVEDIEPFTSFYIPSTITELNINNWLYFHDQKEIIIPSTIKEIKELSLEGNTELTHLEFENGTTSIKSIVYLEETEQLKQLGFDFETVLFSNFTIALYSLEYLNKLKKIKYIRGLIQDSDSLTTIPSNFTKIHSLNCFRSIESLSIPPTVKFSTKNFEFTNSTYSLDTSLQELTLYKHHVSHNPHILGNLTSLTKLEVIDGSFDDIVVSYNYHSLMK